METYRRLRDIAALIEATLGLMEDTTSDDYTCAAIWLDHLNKNLEAALKCATKAKRLLKREHGR